MITNKEKSRISKCELDFFRVHKELSPCDANVQLLADEMDRLLLAADNPESYEIALLSCGSRLARASASAPAAAPEVVEPAPSPSEMSITEIIEEVGDDVRPDFSWSKEQLRQKIRADAAKKIPASLQREEKRKATDRSKVAGTFRDTMQSLIDANPEEKKQ